jgi:hypothetical protein
MTQLNLLPYWFESTVSDQAKYIANADEQYNMPFIESYKQRVEDGLMPASQQEVQRSLENQVAAFALPHRLPIER